METQEAEQLVTLTPTYEVPINDPITLVVRDESSANTFFAGGPGSSDEVKALILQLLAARHHATESVSP